MPSSTSPRFTMLPEKLRRNLEAFMPEEIEVKNKTPSDEDEPGPEEWQEYLETFGKLLKENEDHRKQLLQALSKIPVVRIIGRHYLFNPRIQVNGEIFFFQTISSLYRENVRILDLNLTGILINQRVNNTVRLGQRLDYLMPKISEQFPNVEELIIDCKPEWSRGSDEDKLFNNWPADSKILPLFVRTLRFAKLRQLRRVHWHVNRISGVSLNIKDQTPLMEQAEKFRESCIDGVDLLNRIVSATTTHCVVDGRECLPNFANSTVWVDWARINWSFDVYCSSEADPGVAYNLRKPNQLMDCVDANRAWREESRSFQDL
ncbi:hypothetical protein MMC25_006848 [Agyrium rufum]|nr:hypothetical protein [Agyrium rufum]